MRRYFVASSPSQPWHGNLKKKVKYSLICLIICCMYYFSPMPAAIAYTENEAREERNGLYQSQIRLK